MTEAALLGAAVVAAGFGLLTGSDSFVAAGFCFAAVCAVMRLRSKGQTKSVNSVSDSALVGISCDVFVLATALVSVVYWWALSGVPAFRHDWLINPGGGALARFLSAYGSTWQPSGLGFANAQAGFYPTIVALSWVARGAGSHWAVVILLFFVMAIAGLSARRAIRKVTGCRAIPCTIGAIWYLLCPVPYNEIVAGHLLLLIGIAILPCAILATACLADANRLRNILILGALLALAVPEPQSFLIAMVASLALSAARGTLLEGVCAVSIAFLLTAPTYVAAAASPGDTYLLKHAVIEWQRAESGLPSLVLRGAGYLTRYWADAATTLSAACAGAIAIIAWLYLRRAGRAAAALMLLGLLAGMVVMGFNGPLSHIIWWSFINIDAFSMIRETYDVAPLYTLAISIGLAGTVQLVIHKYGARPALALGSVCIVLVLIGGWPYLAGREWASVPVVGDASVSAALANMPGSGRYFWIPGVYPLRTASGKGLGYDPYATTLGRHSSITAMEPIPAIARAYALLGRRDAAGALQWLASLGVQYIVIDTDAARADGKAFPDARSVARTALGISKSLTAYGPIQLRRLETERHMVESVGVNIADGMVQSPSRHETTMYIGDPANLEPLKYLGFLRPDARFALKQPSHITADPRKGLVAAQYAWQSVSLVADMPATDAVVGISQTFNFGPGLLVGAWDKAPVVKGGRGIGSRFLQSRETIRFPGRFGLIGVLSGIKQKTPNRSLPFRDASITYSRVDSTQVSFRVDSGSPSAIIFRERFDPGWKLDVPASTEKATHFRADGWANGWVLHLHRGEIGSIIFTPQRVFAHVVDASRALWLLCLMGVLVLTLLPRLHKIKTSLKP